MSEQNPPPWWAWGVAGGAIAWLLALLKGAWSAMRTTETAEEKQFRDRIERDMKAVNTSIDYLTREIAKVDKRLGILEDRSDRRSSGEHGV